MGLSSDLISQFVKVTKDEEPVKQESTVYGTMKVYDGKTYVQLDGSDLLTPVSTTADANDGERVTVLIKNHTATVTGNISSPSARTDTVKEIGDQISEFEVVVADKVSTKQLAASVASIKKLLGDEAVINELEANGANIGELYATVASIEKLNADIAEIDKLIATKADISLLEAKYALIEDLTATNAKLNNLISTYGDFQSLTTEKFEAVDADIKNLVAEDVVINTALAEKATIADLEAAEARIGKIEAGYLTASSAEITDLQSDVAEIDTLIFGSASGSTIQTTFANAVIAMLGDAQIKAAMIESITADQIVSGDILTNNVRVVSEDGKLVISDETIQISDENRVRVQIGKDAKGDYSINIWDADGNLMFSEGGITDSAIKEAIIRDDMVSDTANISASKLNIDSLFSVINEDGSNTLKASKILLDADNQTLDVAFKEMTDSVDGLNSTVESQGTDISVIQGQIESKIWKQEIDEATDEMSTQYSELKQNVDSISATVASHTSQIATKADSSTVYAIRDRVTNVETDLDGFRTSVSETYATKESVDGIQIGARNLIRNATSMIYDSYCFGHPVPGSSKTSAKLGKAILGSIILGSE